MSESSNAYWIGTGICVVQWDPLVVDFDMSVVTIPDILRQQPSIIRMAIELGVNNIEMRLIGPMCIIAADIQSNVATVLEPQMSELHFGARDGGDHKCLLTSAQSS